MTNEFGEIMQHGYIVDDMEKAAHEWSQRLGVAPFYVLDRIDMDHYYYRGVHTKLAMSLAFGYWGDIQIELVQPLNEEETFYSHALESAPGRINHVATVVKDLDGLLERRQLRERVVQSGKMPTGLQFVYLEEYLPGGLHLELIEAQEDTLQAWSGMREAAIRWDGTNPVRPMSALAHDLGALANA